MAQEPAFDIIETESKKRKLSSDLFVDECYFSLLFNDEEDECYFSLLFNDEEEEETFTVSDSRFAEGLQFQEVLMASTIIASSLNAKQDPIETQTAVGESSFCFCDICAERKDSDQMFKTDGCVHSYCSDCVSRHVAAKIQDSITIITCPGLDCKAVLERDTCGPVISKEVFDQWNDALCEELISASQKFYCPFKDCSAMLVNDSEGEVITESECPFCHRLFCAQCQVPWHPGVECEEYQRLNEDERGIDDLMVRDIAKEKKWSRCPNCKFYVERTEGCPHITCRCNFQFCYGCEAEWTQNHGGCHK